MDNGLVLAMDTTGDVCSVAAVRHETLASEHIFRHGMHLSERLLEHVDAVLKEASATAEEITSLAVGLGPGSFTGTRIGVMTMKTFASLLARPIYGVDSLSAMASPYSGLPHLLVVPMHPCRSGIVFCGCYRAAMGGVQTAYGPAALSIPELVDIASRQDRDQLLFTGPAAEAHREEIENCLQEHARSAVWNTGAFPRASDIAKIALYRMFTGAAPDDALSMAPLYVAPPPITMPKGAPTPPAE